MKRTCHHIGYQKVSKHLRPGPSAGNRASIPDPVETNTGHFQPPGPIPPGAKCKKVVRVRVEVEAGEGHDEIVEIVLEGYNDTSEGVDLHNAVVV